MKFLSCSQEREWGLLIRKNSIKVIIKINKIKFNHEKSPFDNKNKAPQTTIAKNTPCRKAIFTCQETNLDLDFLLIVRIK